MRLFTAICFDDETKNALFAAGKKAKENSEGNFTLCENLHLTLVFIGETERKTEIEKAIGKIDFPKFEIKFKGTGFFEKGIFWAGTEENENLEKLQKEIRKKLEELGFEPEEREYIPHITLARKFRPGEAFDEEEVSALLPQKPIKANRISLMKSERVEGVLKYTEIFSKDLF